MEQILALFDSTTTLSSSIVIQLVQKAISHKSIFGFAEFYEPLRARQRAASEDHINQQAKIWIDILEVYTYGTWKDLCALKEKTDKKEGTTNAEQGERFPELNKAQLKKMKQLTLVTLASMAETLEYETISEALQPAWKSGSEEDSEMKGTGSDEKVWLDAEIEPLVIDTIYTDMLEARIHSREREIEVLRVSGRDVSIDRLEEISNILTDWDEMAMELLRKTRESIESAQNPNDTTTID